MPYEVKIGSRWGGLARNLLEVTEQRRKRQEEQEDEFRTFNRDLQKILLQRDDLTDEATQAILSGKPVTGVPLRRTSLFDPSQLKPGQSYSQRVDGGTLSSQGPPRPEDASKEKRRDIATATTLRKQFDAYPEVKNFIEVETQLNLMDKTYARWQAGEISSANTVDQALVNTFGRMVDPGVSIREAEYQRTPENMSLVNRADALLQRLRRGGVLNNAERESLMQVANILGEARATPYNLRLQEYNTLAEDYGLDPKVVTLGRKPYQALRRTPMGASFASGFEGGRSQGSRPGGVLMEDANGNRAIVYPDGTFEELP